MKIVQLSINTLSYVKRLKKISNACDPYKILTKNTCYIWCIVIQN